MAKAYDPARIEADGSLVSNYMVETAGDRYFIPAYPIGGTMGQDAAETAKLSPYGSAITDDANAVGPTGTTYSTSEVLAQDATPTANLSHGDMWFNTTTSTLMVYVDDGNSQQWVAA